MEHVFRVFKINLAPLKMFNVLNLFKYERANFSAIYPHFNLVLEMVRLAYFVEHRNPNFVCHHRKITLGGQECEIIAYKSKTCN